MPIVYIVTLGLTILFACLAENTVPKYCSIVLLENGTLRKRPERHLAILAAGVLIYVAGFRYYVGTDYGAYYTGYVDTVENVLIRLITLDEPGMYVISMIGRLLYAEDGTMLIFLSAAITIGLYVKTMHEHSPMFTVSMVLYVFMGTWQGCFNGVRQYFAAAILFLGHKAIYERRFKRYCCFVLLATLFHKTAIIMLIAYPLLMRKPDRNQFVFLMIGALIIRYSYDFLFVIVGALKDSQMSISDSSYFSTQVNILRIAVGFVPVVIYGAFCEKQNLTRKDELYVNAVFLNAFTMMAAMGSAYIARIAIYTEAMVLISYAHLFGLIKDRKIRLLTMCAVMGMYAIYWWYSVVIASSLSNFMWIFDYR